MKNPHMCLLGAIAGDMIGSVYEFNAPKTTEFELFTPGSQITDDSILTLAVAEAILNGRSYLDAIREYALEYPNSGYGGMFRRWMHAENPQPYNSFGNGSAMRVSPVGWAFNTVEEVLREAEASAAVTHNHPEGIKGAQAVALAIFCARSTRARKMRFEKKLPNALAMTWPAAWMRSVQAIISMRPARRLSRRRSLPFWNLRILRMPFARPFRWAAMPIPWRPSLAPSPRPFTVVSRRRS